jgi:hypothetical protein
MNPKYREQILENINQLSEARNIIFFEIVNLAMKFEHSDIDNTFEEGDQYTFTLQQFENSKDVNVQKLVELCKKVEETVFTLMDLNGIDEDEVEL